MNVLACNVGSTSLKFKLFVMPECEVIAEGRIERVGSADDAIFRYANPANNISYKKERQSIPSYTEGIRMFLAALTSPNEGVVADIAAIEAVVFKTVLAKGFYGVHTLTDAVMDGMREYMDIASSHNGPYIEAINRFKEVLPQAKMVGSFETGFHQTIPLERTLYGIPYDWYERFGICKMGYHGASHGFIAGRIGELLGDKKRLISCHLGGSNSICAILDGKSVDTSFGISLHTGVLHATRAGDVDTYLVPFLLGRGLTLDEIDKGLTKRGGLLGISGISEDMRYIEQAMREGSERANLAINTYCSSIVRYIGAFYAELGGLDAIVFTGGIGENSALVRQRVCEPLRHMGVIIDTEKNESKDKEIEMDISAAGAAAKTFVVAANEELEIARRCFTLLKSE